MPYKTWAPFERLLSDDMNGYLSEQTPAIFTNAAARDTAIPAPILGQPVYLTGIRALQRWNGSVWKTEAIAGGCAATILSAANQSVASGTAVKILLATVGEDLGGFALGSSQLTVPVGLGGLYQLLGSIFWASATTATGYRDILLKVGAVTAARAIQAQGANSIAAIQSIGALWRLNDGDVVELWGGHTQGAAINSTTDTYAPRLSIIRIGD